MKNKYCKQTITQFKEINKISEKTYISEYIK